MIEKSINGVPHWWMRRPGQDEYWDKPGRWTSDPNKGRKYATKNLAEYVMGRDMAGCIATEHVWMGAEDAPQDIVEEEQASA
jgi:hypothetical protein